MAANTQQARTITTEDHGKLDVRALVLLAVLLAAGFILNFTVGKAISSVSGGMISPEFIISAFCLTILVIRPNVGQALIIGLISAAVIQFTTSIPGLNFVTELVAALAMAALIKLDLKVAGRNVTPLAAAFVTTLLSGALFAVAGTLIMGAALATVAVKVPLVLGTAVFNAIVVQALYFPLNKVLNR